MKEEIRSAAYALGFDRAGFAQTRSPLLKLAERRYRAWIERGYSARMEYLERHAPKKFQPEQFFASARSVLALGLGYGTADRDLEANRSDRRTARVSIYARGDDYHQLFREKLLALRGELATGWGIESREFCDLDPVADRTWAAAAGLGWVGKNSCVIDREKGSYFFLGGLFLDREIEPDAESPDHCGRCRKCIEACPTNAITESREVDSGRCIAYHTIENRGEVPDEVKQKWGRWIGGCDICQEVCPWNDPPTVSSHFGPSNPAFGATFETLAAWNRAEFESRMARSALLRMKYSGFLRNLAIALTHSALTAEAVQSLLARIRGHAGEIPYAPEREAVLSTIAWAEGTQRGRS